jgi:branched-chain amino acid transport system ATP-binding protein
MSLIEIEGLTVRYGPIPALRDISLTLEEGETLAVVGANGAGKSTLTLAIAGVVRPAAGRIAFAGQELAGIAPEEIARSGVALVPEGRHIFEGLTVEENLLLGLTARGFRSRGRRALDAVYAAFPVLGERRAGLGTRLSGGEQQQLAIARALLSEPRLLILDEPSLGLAPVMVDRVYAILRDLRATGASLLLVEQNPSRVGEIADRVVVLAGGRIGLQGSAAAVVGSAALGAAYLGAARDAAA